MWRVVVNILLLAGISSVVKAQQEKVAYSLELDSVSIVGKRPLKNTGIQKTRYGCITRQHSSFTSRYIIRAFNSICQKLRPCHTINGRIQRDLGITHASNVERYEDQFSDARDRGLFHDSLLFYR